MASKSQSVGLKEQVIVSDLILVQYDSVFHSGEVKDKRGGSLQVNIMIPAGKTTWK